MVGEIHLVVIAVDIEEWTVLSRGIEDKGLTSTDGEEETRLKGKGKR
jgi:hypothetical protein